MKGFRRYTVLGYTAVCLVAAVPAGAGASKCPPDSVKVGTVCVDLYEASVWQIDPIANASLVTKVQAGKATLADLRGGLGTVNNPSSPKGILLSPASSCVPSYPQIFPPDGNWLPVLMVKPGGGFVESNPPSPGVYALSLPGVEPSTCITWFQANQACQLSGKHLLTNVEWQGAAAGTPDPGTDNGTTDCAISSGVVKTGSRATCKSSWGVFDMVGNVEEWVGDWADRANVGCTDWTSQTGIPGNDRSCFGGDGVGAANQLPAALARGGGFSAGTNAGVFDVDARNDPSFSAPRRGFRCAR